MNAYMLGNLLGRLIASYLLVWAVYLIINRFNWRHAFRKTNGWAGASIVIIVFFLGLAGAAINQ